MKENLKTPKVRLIVINFLGIQNVDHHPTFSNHNLREIPFQENIKIHIIKEAL
jgi:hypothetical protein